MSNSLIINIRQQLHWYQRFFSDSSTALMWGMWLYLWRPLVVITGAHAFSKQPFLVHFVTKISPMTMGYIIVSVMCGALALLLWTLLPARRIIPSPQKSLSDYATHFQLPEQEITAGRAANICTVHHDAYGRVIGIEPQQA
jgi:poly-beta-1,6-N-acetyl-D-glucosamine biosynthesis protein PgaD